MTEDDARGWLVARFGSAALPKLERLVDLVAAESPRQNLISSTTLPEIWSRHIADSAQLAEWAAGSGRWLDIGTGAGFPGMVVAILGYDVTMVEPRRKRVEFLDHCIRELGIAGHTRVVQGRVEGLTAQPFAIISARAVGVLSALLTAAARCSNPETVWLLPKGRNAEAEVAEARRTWHGMFHVEHSITDPSSLIVVANGVRRR